MDYNIGKCPCCRTNVVVICDEEKLPRSFTTTCGCGFTILYEEGQIFDFHKKLHEEDPRWPEDGKGTYSVDIK